MIITGKHLSRRALLRGAGGVAIALPFLDAMHPALAAEAKTAAAPVRRLGVVFHPLGVIYEKWAPMDAGGPLNLNTPALTPLAAHTSKINIIAGLSSDPDRTKSGFHDRGVASWLTGIEMAVGKIYVGTSMDQIAAAKLGKETQFASLEMGTESPNLYSVPMYKNATTPLPIEINPRIVFERLFGDGGRIDSKASALQNELDKSTLDGVVERIAALKRRVGASDARKLDQYLESIRDVERRIQLAAAQSNRVMPTAERPAGAPLEWPDHVKLMLDMQVLAYQADLTRVGSFMTLREGSGHTFPHLGVTYQHHEASHHNYDPAKLDALFKINRNHSELFAYYLSKLDAVQEPSGSLLDNSVILFGSSLSNSTVHSQRHLPIMLAGGAGGRLKGGRHIVLKGDPAPWPIAAKMPANSPIPLTNLHLALLDKVGVPIEKLGDSTGALSL